MTRHDTDFTGSRLDHEGTGRADGGDAAPADTLGGIRRTETIAETLRFRRTLVDPQLVLQPTDSSDPGGEIQFYEQSGARSSLRRTMTVDSLTEALRVAVNRIHQFEG